MNPRAMQAAPIMEPITWPLSAPWLMYYQGVFAAAQPQGGFTSKRPSNPVLYQPYFDTSLGKPIWCVQITPTPAWVDATGASV